MQCTYVAAIPSPRILAAQDRRSVASSRSSAASAVGHWHARVSGIADAATAPWRVRMFSKWIRVPPWGTGFRSSQYTRLCDKASRAVATHLKKRRREKKKLRIICDKRATRGRGGV
jgi:hypothetical protein